MGKHEAAYLGRIGDAFAEIDAEIVAPRSAEDAMQEFFALMESVVPVLDALPRPTSADDSDPDELGLYRRWREVEGRRGRHT